MCDILSLALLMRAFRGVVRQAVHKCPVRAISAIHIIKYLIIQGLEPLYHSESVLAQSVRYITPERWSERKR